MTLAGDKPAVAGADGATAPPRLRTALLFASLVVGSFIVLLDVSILNVALPDVKSDLNASAAELPWTVDAYTVVFAGMLMAAGAVADRFGPRRVYRIALGLFAFISLLCAAAPNAISLIAGRALLGASAAGLLPAALALLAALYPDPAKRARAVGAWAAFSSIGFIIGPPLSGALVELGGWRLVFLINPLVVLLAALPTRGLSGHRPSTHKQIDKPGLVLTIIGLAALTFGFIDAGTNGWSRPVPLVAIGVGVVAFIVLTFVERRVPTPILPPKLMSLGRVRADLAAGFLASFVFYGAFFGLTMFVIHAKGYTPLQAGLAFLPMTLPSCVLPYLSGRAVGKLGSRVVILAGFAFTLASAIGLIFADASTPLAVMIVWEILLTIGGTMVIPAATADMTGAAPKEFTATAMGALSASRQAGVALGVAVLGTASSLSLIGVVIAIGSAVALVVVATVLRTPRTVAA